MKKMLFVMCGIFSSEISGMHLDKEMEFSERISSVGQAILFKPTSYVSDSEATLNGEISPDNLNTAEVYGFAEHRRRSRSEEVLFPVPFFDEFQSREFSEGRRRSKSETVDDDMSGLNVSTMLELKKRREEQSNLIENENLNDMLKVSARQLAPFLGGDFFQRFKNSGTCIDKIKILTQGSVEYIKNCAKQKKEASEEKEKLKGSIRDLKNKLSIAENQQKIVSSEALAEDKDPENMTERPSKFHSQDTASGISSLRIRKFEYMGEMDGEVACGKGTFSHVCGVVSIAGTFYHDSLDLSKEVVIKGPSGEKYKFRGINNADRRVLISMQDLSKVSEAYRFDMSSICLKLSGDEEKGKWIIFNPDFVYQGEVSDRDISGRGRVVKITGEMQEGEFKNGRYLCE